MAGQMIKIGGYKDSTSVLLTYEFVVIVSISCDPLYTRIATLLIVVVVLLLVLMGLGDGDDNSLLSSIIT